jgi:PhnB protein
MAVRLTPYIHFVANAQEALDFYKSILSAEVEIYHFGDVAGMPVDEESKNLVMHSVLKFGDQQLYISDSKPMGGVAQNGENITLSLSGNDSDSEVLSGYFQKLSDGGKVTDELNEKPWGAKFGMVTDKFGVHWMVNIDNPKQ